MNKTGNLANLPSSYLTYGNLICSIGSTIDQTWNSIIAGKTGIKIDDNHLLNKQWPVGYISTLTGPNRFEDLFRRTIIDLKDQYIEIFNSSKTIFIISSTKGNIDKYPADPFGKVFSLLKDEFGLKNHPVIISNACISGVLAINLANDFIMTKKYNQAIIIGIDVVSDFVINGFQSLYALSNSYCKPYDKDRNGINLGEASASLILSRESINQSYNVQYLSGSSSNDANHISGPSRSGEGLVRTITKTLSLANIDKHQIDYISGHGTATIYNDEMEGIAFDRLGMNQSNINSLKGYFGHTLGAAGVIETIISMKSMENNQLIKSLGFDKLGLSKNLNVIKKNTKKPINLILKTASGFGGGNASLILKKEQID